MTGNIKQQLLHIFGIAASVIGTLGAVAIQVSPATATSNLSQWEHAIHFQKLVNLIVGPQLAPAASGDPATGYLVLLIVSFLLIILGLILLMRFQRGWADFNYLTAWIDLEMIKRAIKDGQEADVVNNMLRDRMKIIEGWSKLVREFARTHPSS